MNERWLLHPASLVGLTTMIVNDHLLKWHWPGWVTGKLSDVAGLVFFPLVLAGLVGARRVSAVAGCALVTAVIFASIKLIPAATELWRDALSSGQWLLRTPMSLLAGDLPRWAEVEAVTDPTDLIAVPFALVAVVVARRRPGRAILPA